MGEEFYEGSELQLLWQFDNIPSRETCEVLIGEIPCGGKNPIRIQSMVDTDTLDTDATVEQFIRIVKAGADYVRVAVKSTKDAENLKNIKEAIRARGYKRPS